MSYRAPQKWTQIVRGGDARVAETFGIDPLTARIILNRDLSSDEEIRRFLYGTLDDMDDPLMLDQISEAAELLHEKILQHKPIRVLGDYDADGICSTYILCTAIKKAGGEVSFDIPDRVADGFGMSMRMIEKAHADGIDTIITCDNGISQIAETARARELGMTVIITDHHEPNYALKKAGDEPDVQVEYLLPDANVIVDPRKPGCRYPNKSLCGAGVAWKLMHVYESRYMVKASYGALQGPSENQGSILADDGSSVAENSRTIVHDSVPGNSRTSGQSQEVPESLLPVMQCPVTMENLPFAAMATVTDIMKLQGENRILVKNGLRLLSDTKNIGLRALLKSNSLEDKDLSTYHIGFVIGPCLNASGRLDTAKRAINLLLETDPRKAAEEAASLTALNIERKAMTEDGKLAAFEKIENSDLIHDRVLIVYLEGIHESVAGIIASKVKENYHRPVMVFTDTEDPDHLKGSGRSIEEYNMHAELSRVGDVFVKFGGHPMAAGATICRDRLEELRTRLNLNCTLTPDDLTEKIQIDAAPPLSFLTEDLEENLSLLEPTGTGNRAPLFGCSQVELLRFRIIGRKQNCVKLLVRDKNCRMDALYFGDPQTLIQYLKEKGSEEQFDNLMQGRPNTLRLTLAYKFRINEYQGTRTPQIQIAHFQ